MFSCTKIYFQLVNDLTDRYEGRVSWDERDCLKTTIKSINSTVIRSKSVVDNQRNSWDFLGKILF